MSAADREIVTTRAYLAPRTLVYRAFTEPQHLTHWWGPNGFRTTTHEMDVRVGGVWKFTMHGPDGKDWPNKVVYTEVVPGERLAYDHGDFEREHFKAEVTMVEQGGVTTVTLRCIFPSAEACAQVKAFGAVEGGKQTLARLAVYLPTMPK